MTAHDWLTAPVGLDAPRWITRSTRRTIVVATHTMTSCQRLLDVTESIETDPRIQIVFTVAPDAFNRALDGYLADLGAIVMPWQQATRERFDLAIAAAYGGIAELHAPVMVMAHGAGYGKRVTAPQRGTPVHPEPPVYGLDAQRLTRDGAVLASAIVLAHDNERAVLARQCPQALPVAVVAGDVCYDRLLASLEWRPRYRDALGLDDGQRLVVVSSTWGPHGLFGSAPELLSRVMDQLAGDGYRVAALLHPAVWSAHGHRQVLAWLRDCRDAGLILLGPGEDWRGLLVAGDVVIGDHGSVTAYAAALGRPVLHLAPRGVRLNPASAQHVVSRTATQLRLGDPLAPQVNAARPLDEAAIAAAITSCPGRADLLLRRTVYRLLRLRAPALHRAAAPVPVPRVLV